MVLFLVAAGGPRYVIKVEMSMDFEKENVNNIEITHLHWGLQLIFDESQKEGNDEYHFILNNQQAS